MLENVREPWRKSRTKSILAYVLFGLICLTFVFVGVTPDQGGGIGSAATVNDKVIALADFQERVSSIENQASALLSQLPAAERQRQTEMIRKNALGELISFELIFQSAEKAGVLATAAAVRDVIVNIPIFQENGRFARELYNRFLTFRNTTATELENRIKRDVVIGQTRELFMAAIKAPTVLSVLEQQVQETKLELDFVKIDSLALQTGVLKNKEELNAFLSNAENQPKFQANYDSRLSEYTTAPEVRAQHILIKETSAESLERIKKIQADVKAQDFSVLAQQHSEDEVSKAKGGDLGFFKAGQMVLEFEKAAFSLPIGQVSDVVKTSYGYHLIKVLEKRGGQTTPFLAVKEEIAKKLFVDQEKEKFLADITASLLNQKQLDQLLSQLNLKWQSTGVFSLDANSVPRIESQQAMKAALSLKKVNDVFPSLIQDGEANYIVKLKSIRRPTIGDKSASAAMGISNAGAETFGLWVEDLKKDARIVQNEALFNF